MVETVTRGVEGGAQAGCCPEQRIYNAKKKRVVTAAPVVLAASRVRGGDTDGEMVCVTRRRNLYFQKIAQLDRREWRRVTF